MSRSGSHTSGRSSNYSRASRNQYPPGTPDFDRYSRSSYSNSRSRAESPEYEAASRDGYTQYASDSQDSGRYSPISAYSRPSIISGTGSDNHRSRRDSDASQNSLRNNSRLSARGGQTPTPKSVSFDPAQVPVELEEEEEQEPLATYSADASRIPASRGSDTSSADSSLRRARGAAVNEAKRKVQELYNMCNEFFAAYSTWLILAGLVMAAVLYGGRLAVRDTAFDAHQTYEQMTETAGKIREDLNHPAHAAFDDSKRRFNFTAEMEPLWDFYSEILVETEFEEWFDDVRDAEDAITAMWNTLPETQNDTIRKRTRAMADVDRRKEYRMKAEALFENFLLARTHVVGEMLGIGHTWIHYIRGLQWNDSRVEIADMVPTDLAIEPFCDYPTADNWTAKNMTRYQLTCAARGLLQRLDSQHQKFIALLEDEHKSRFQKQHNVSTTTGNTSTTDPYAKLGLIGSVIKAQAHERNFTQILVETSPISGDVWDQERHDSLSMKHLSTKLQALHSMMLKMQNRIAAMIRSLENELDREKNNVNGKTRKTWTQDVQAMLDSWNLVFDRTASAQSCADSRRYEMKQGRVLASQRSKLISERAKHCSIASCHSAFKGPKTGIFAVLRNIFSARQSDKGEKASGVFDKDESSRVEDAGGFWDVMSLGEMEKKCCGTSHNNRFLDWLEYGETELLYLNATRDR